MKEALQGYLQLLHARAGAPGTREIGEKAGCSHSTVARALSGERQPSYGTLIAIVRTLNGDTQVLMEILGVGQPPVPFQTSKQGNRQLLVDILGELQAIRVLLEQQSSASQTAPDQPQRLPADTGRKIRPSGGIDTHEIIDV